MAWKALVAGADQTHQISGDVSIEPSLNGRSIANFTCKPGYSPNRFQEVTLYANDLVTVLFGGVVNVRRIREPETGSKQFFTEVECSDYFIYTDWSYTTRAYTSPVTLKTVLTDLVADLPGSYGITLDAGQVNGPTLEPFSWAQGVKISDAIRELMGRSPGYVARISPTKVLKAFVIGTDVAPHTMTDAEPHHIKFEWTDNDNVPANKITLVCGPTGSLVSPQRWTKGAGEVEWEVDIQAVLNGWTQGYVRENPDGFPGSHTDRTLGLPGSGGYYIWTDTDGKGTVSIGTGAAPANGTVLELNYTAQYPFTVTATTGATPVKEERRAYPNVLAVGPAQEIADSLLVQFDQESKDLSIVSLDHGWLPGQNLTVTLTNRITGTCKITAVLITLSREQIWSYQISATTSTTYLGNYLDEWRTLLTGDAGTVVSTASAPAGGISGSGTPGKHAIWSSIGGLTDGIISDNGVTATVTGALAVTTTLAVTGVATFNSRLELATSVAFPGAVTDRGRGYYNAVTGLTLYGAGSTYDLGLVNKNGGLALGIPTGTMDISIPAGSLTVLKDTAGTHTTLSVTGNANNAGGNAVLVLADLIGSTLQTPLSYGARVRITSEDSLGQIATGFYAQPVTNPGNFITWYGAYFATKSGAGVITNTYAIVTESGAGNIGFGTVTPVRRLHLSDGSSGVASGDSSTVLFIEKNASASITIATTNTAAGAIYFADPQSNVIGRIAYFHDTDKMDFQVSGAVKVNLTSSGLTPAADQGTALGTSSLRWGAAYVERLNVGGTADPGAGNARFAANAVVVGSIGGPSYVSQTTEWRITAAGEADFRYAIIDELYAKAFIADLEQALAGGQIITKSVAMVNAAYTVPARGANVTSITRSGSTATVTTTSDHGFSTGDAAYISGANEGDYNGLYVIIVTGATTFTYTVGGTPATPATGTITTRGAAYLNVKDLPGAADMAVFQVNDTVVLRSFSRTNGGLVIGDAIGTVISFDPSGSGFQTWLFIRNLSPNGGSLARGAIIQADSLALDYGVSGNGYYEVSAVDGMVNVSSISRSGSTATLTSTFAHGFLTGDSVWVSGANQSEYNGLFTITVTSATTFTYTVSGTPITPATGTILVNGTNGTNAPYAQIVTWTTAPTGANKTLRARFGNLRGITGVTNEYGIIAGTYAATNGAFFRASNAAFDLHGITARWWSSAVNVVTINPNGTSPYISIGSPAPTAYGANAGIFLEWNTAASKARASFYADANNYLQYDGAKLTWKAANTTLDASGNLTATSGTFSGAITATSGTITGALTVGTGGSFASGATAYGTGTGIWMDYNAGTPRARFGNPAGNKLDWDGTNLNLVSEHLTLNSTGAHMAITTSYADARGYAFTPGSVAGAQFGLFAQGDGTSRYVGIRNISTTNSSLAYVLLEAQSKDVLGATVGPANILLSAVGSTGAVSITMTGAVTMLNGVTCASTLGVSSTASITGGLSLGAHLALAEQGSTPSTPGSGNQVHAYMKADKFIIQYNDGGTVRYKYITLNDDVTSWVHTTTAP